MDELRYYLNAEIYYDEEEFQGDKEEDIKNELFIRGLVEYLNSSYSLMKRDIQNKLDDFMKKSNLSKNFLLSSIDESALNMKIEDLINYLEEAKNLPKEQKRNCFSLTNNPIETQKIIFDLGNVFKKAKKSKGNANPVGDTPAFKGNNIKPVQQKFGKGKNTSKNVASIYRSPSPIVVNKNRKKFPQGDKVKKEYVTPEKKNYWQY